MSDARYQLPHVHADNSYLEYQDWQYWNERDGKTIVLTNAVEQGTWYWAERERRERQLHRRMWRKLQEFADWFDATFGWFFSPRRYK